MKLENLVCIDNNIDLNFYIKFREEVKKHMTNPERLGDFSKTDLETILKYSGKIWVYYLSDEPVCSMMIIPSDEHALKKFEIDENPEDVIDYGPMFVNPKYWGNKLQYQMLRKLDDYCIKHGYKMAIATVHPDNYYSFNNLLKDDFKYTKTKDFSRGIRNIYVKDLRKKGYNEIIFSL